MWKNLFSVLPVGVFLIVTCVLTYPNFAFAVPPLSDSDAKKIIEEGRSQRYVVRIPLGPIQPKNIEIYEKIGLITLSKSQKGPGWIDVAITGKGKKVSSGINEKGEYLFQLGHMKIKKIVKNSEYKTPLANPDEELRLVMGVFEAVLTSIGKEYKAAKGESQTGENEKFRALLKYDPFKEKYVYVTSDWGKIDKDKFETDNIENYNNPMGYKKY